MNERSWRILIVGGAASVVAAVLLGLCADRLGRYVETDPAPWAPLCAAAGVLACGWPFFVRAAALRRRAAVAVATLLALGLGTALSDCGSGSAAFGEACLSDACATTRAKLAYFEGAAGCATPVIHLPARAMLALRCLDPGILRPATCEPAPAPVP